MRVRVGMPADLNGFLGRAVALWQLQSKPVDRTGKITAYTPTLFSRLAQIKRPLDRSRCLSYDFVLYTDLKN